MFANMSKSITAWFRFDLIPEPSIRVSNPHPTQSSTQRLTQQKQLNCYCPILFLISSTTCLTMRTWLKSPLDFVYNKDIQIWAPFKSTCAGTGACVWRESSCVLFLKASGLSFPHSDTRWQCSSMGDMQLVSLTEQPPFCVWLRVTWWLSKGSMSFFFFFFLTF